MKAATMNTLVPFAIVCSYLPWARGVCAVFARVCLARLLMRLRTHYQKWRIRGIRVARIGRVVLRLHHAAGKHLHLGDPLEILPYAGVWADREGLKVLRDLWDRRAKGDLLGGKLHDDLPLFPTRLLQPRQQRLIANRLQIISDRGERQCIPGDFWDFEAKAHKRGVFFKDHFV